jgi:crotonobetainyl-CoA:carnitine CoA-transferase CaiB-like acyl-CoA transferase
MNEGEHGARPDGAEPPEDDRRREAPRSDARCVSRVTWGTCERGARAGEAEAPEDDRRREAPRSDARCVSRVTWGTCERGARAGGAEPPEEKHSALRGVRVLELGQLLAGPWAGTILAYFGAEVIKVEPPSGDPIRTWRALDETGTSYWWRSIARNKRCITLDLREEEGRAIAKRLALASDVLIENFRPGTMEKWGLGPDVLRAVHPGLVYARVSGYGQSGPYASRPGYAAVAEAIGGLRHVTGQPGEPPVRANLSLGDTLAGLHCAIGILVSLFERRESGRGQTVDAALYEAVFSVLESVVPEHSGAGIVRGPSGTTIGGVVPSNLYPCQGERWVVIGANGASLFRRLAFAIERPDLAADPELEDNPGRVRHAARIDAAISAWTRQRTVGQVIDALDAAAVPCGPIYDAADMRADPHFVARELFEPAVTDSGRELELPAIAPKLDRTPGGTRWAGASLGRDTQAVLAELGLTPDEVDSLRARGIV